MRVPRREAEPARASMLSLFAEGFEEADRDDDVELSAYTDTAGEERARAHFGAVLASEVASDWHERWKEFHRPASVGDLWIGPPWQEPPAHVLAVVIDPGRAFGTGAHPTTRLCVEHLTALEPSSLLDIGCGSGVLSIAAAKLGFGPVVAVDRDDAAIEAARRNADVNGVELDLRQADALEDRLPDATTVVANIDERRVAAVAARVSCDVLVTSGYFEHHQPELDGFRHLGRRAEGGWAADLYEPY